MRKGRCGDTIRFLPTLSCFFVFLSFAGSVFPCACAWRPWCSMMGNGTHLDNPLPYNGPPIVSPGGLPDCKRFDPDGKEPVCCSAPQAQFFKDSFVYALQTFGGCPACAANIKTLWCYYTCSPYQGNFVDVLSLNNKGEVDKNNYYITHRSAEMLYEGCRDTPFAGGAPIDTFVQSVEAFLSFMTMTKGNIRIIMNDSRGVDLPMQSCNVSCSCNFCRSACRSAKVTVDTRPTISIGSISLTYLQFTVSVVYLAFVLTVLIVSSVRTCLYGVTSDLGFKEESEESSPLSPTSFSPYGTKSPVHPSSPRVSRQRDPKSWSPHFGSPNEPSYSQDF